MKALNMVKDAVGGAGPSIIYTHSLPGRGRHCCAPPGVLSPRISQPIAKLYPDGLFTHQATAIEGVLSGENVVLCTTTASGKTLAFAASALHMIAARREARCLFL